MTWCLIKHTENFVHTFPCIQYTRLRLWTVWNRSSLPLMYFGLTHHVKCHSSLDWHQIRKWRITSNYMCLNVFSGFHNNVAFLSLDRLSLSCKLLVERRWELILPYLSNWHFDCRYERLRCTLATNIKFFYLWSLYQPFNPLSYP